jgi:hypothetical protein
MGIHHQFVTEDLNFVSYREGRFTVCEDSCPSPKCESGPNELGFDAGLNSEPSVTDDCKTVASSNIPILAFFGALLLAE